MSKIKPRTGPVDECPKCGGQTTARWTTGRMLQSRCINSDDGCFWRGSPYVPLKEPIRTVKSIPTSDFGGWEFEGFDKYGHTMICSQTYSSRAACEASARKEVEQWNQDPNYGPCSAVVWPATVKVRGKLIRFKKVSVSKALHNKRNTYDK
jgi:hypothetical protein